MANENGWGDGVLNNDIGWGQGAVNNDIGWGSIYPVSNAGLTEIYGQSYQPEAAAYFTAIEDAGGTLSDNVKAEWNAFVLREKASSRYTKTKRFYQHWGGVADSIIIDGITLNSAGNINIVNADCDTLIGVTTDGITKALIDFDALSTISSDPSDLQYYTYYLVAPPSGMFYGVRSTSAPAARIYVQYTGTNVVSLLGGGVGNTVAATLTNGQSLMTSITDNGATSNISTWLDGVIIDDDNVTKSTTLTNIQPAYFAYNLNGIISTFSAQKSACNVLFQGMTDAEMVAFDTSYKTFLTNIGAI